MKSKKLWFLVSSLIIAAVTVISCGPTTPPAEEQPTPPPATQEPTTPSREVSSPPAKETTPGQDTPQYGGIFKQVLPWEPLYFDEVLGHIYYAHSLRLTNEELTTGDWSKGPAGTGEWSFHYVIFEAPNVQRGQLAESWEMPDANTIIFRIRKGIHFARNPASEASRLVNGRELTADDVVFSLKRLFTTPTSYSAATYPWDSHFESITAPDKWTVVVKSIPGKFGLIYEMITDHSKIVAPEVVQKYGNMSDWKNSVGTGPFILTDYVNGSSLTYTKNPGYWDKDPIGTGKGNQLPYLEGVKQLIIPDISTRMAAMRTGKIDWIGGYLSPVLWEDAESLMKTNPELKYLGYPAGDALSIHWRTDTVPYSDKRVRRALSMAVNRKEMVDTYFGGHADILIWPVANIPEFSDIHVPLDKLPESTREIFEYHPDKAKQILAEAGFPNGFKAEVVCGKNDVDQLSIVKAYWAKVGVDLELQVKEAGALSSMALAKSHKQMMTGRISGTVPFRFLYDKYPGGTHAISMVNDAKINQTLEAVTAARFDEPKRRQLMKDIVPYELDQAWMLQLPGPYWYTFWHPWIKNYHGEFDLGYSNYDQWLTYVWIDQQSKDKMGK